MKAGKSSATAIFLPSPLGEPLGRLERLVVGGDAAHQLDQLHHRHRVHEVHADEALRPVGGGGEAGDGDRGGVGGEKRVRACSAAQSSAKILRLTASFSLTASMTRSTSASCSRDSAGWILPIAALRSASVDAAGGDLPREIAVDRREPGVDRAPRSHREAAPDSRASAQTWAMPLPICPAPITPILFIVAAILALRSARREYFASCGKSGSPKRRSYRGSYAAQPTGAARLSSSFSSSGRTWKRSADEAVVGDLEDRRLLVLVDGDDDLGILHAGEMLDGAGYAAGDVEVRRDDLAGLADLPVVRRIAGIDGGAAGAHGRAELVGDRQDDLHETSPSSRAPGRRK